ncbi:hypothetical protein DFH05DRAFT_118511 [Lentinula detonsa]|uniref:Uncharacterized protein n=1 Tax=Lentinula detonsa TaxID=2804962 RepID=A0A9W8PBN3_9AGAR|nr:hypothetical protein DFH05DRAFT_118511 [Lentinula detonsa]
MSDWNHITSYYLCRLVTWRYRSPLAGSWTLVPVQSKLLQNKYHHYYGSLQANDNAHQKLTLPIRELQREDSCQGRWQIGTADSSARVMIKGGEIVYPKFLTRRPIRLLFAGQRKFKVLLYLQDPVRQTSKSPYLSTCPFFKIRLSRNSIMYLCGLDIRAGLSFRVCAVLFLGLVCAAFTAALPLSDNDLSNPTSSVHLAARNELKKIPMTLRF